MTFQSKSLLFSWQFVKEGVLLRSNFNFYDMKNKLFLIAAILNVALFCGCDHKDLVDGVPSGEIVKTSVSTERMVFASNDEIDARIEQIKQNERLGVATKANSNFVSLNDYLREEALSSLTPEELAEVEAEGLIYDPEDEIIADPYFCELLNPQREIEVDGKIYKYVKEGIFRCDVKDASLLEEVDKGLIQVPEGTFEEFANVKGSLEFISRNFIPMSIPETVQTRAASGSTRGDLVLDNGEIIREQDIRDMEYDAGRGDAGKLQHLISKQFGENTVVEVNFSKTKRMKLRMYSQDFVIKHTLGMTVRMQKRKLRIWWRTKAEEFRFGWKGLELWNEYDANPIKKVPVLDIRTGVENLHEPQYITKNFPFSDTEHVFFTIPWLNYKSVTTRDVNNLFKSVMGRVTSYLKTKLDGFKQGAYSVKEETSKAVVYLLYPQEEKIEKNTGREVVEFELIGLSGEFDLGVNINLGTWSPSIKRVSVKPLKRAGIDRGEVYAAVRYDGQWKAARIYTK